jgi:tetratricopeptide (TPR) repeat protein
MFNNRIILVITTMVLIVISGTVILQRCRPKEQNTIATQSGDNEFIGVESCKSCHSSQFKDWEQSHHFMAMQPANDSTVLGDFNNRTFTADGVTSKFFKKDGKYFINTEGDDVGNRDYEVKYIFGFTPLQQYLVEFPGGRMQVPRVSWDTKQKRWYHQYAHQNIGAKDWLHWTGNSQNWNTMCASCHSTNLQKNYNIESDIYNTSYSVINVSCESCHGPAKLHVDYVKSDDYKSGHKIAGSYLFLKKGSEQLAEINTCAPCHALKADISSNVMKSDEIMDNLIPEIPSTEHFQADGQIDDESYIYTSFLQSKMFHRNVKCSSCHNPHSGKILYPLNQLCLQCHSKTYDSPSHSFHASGINSVDCKSCHMPGKVYMGTDLRHDHSFRVPRPDLSVKYGTTNACNNCHTNKNAQWATDAITKWYGPVRKYHFSDDLLPASKLDANSEKHLVKLLGDTSVPNIIQATAAYYLGSVSSAGSIQALIKCLSHNDAHIRYRALRSLSNQQPSVWVDHAGPLLSDKVRAVRIAAADLFLTIPNDQIPAQFSRAYTSARNELQNYLNYQADFAVGNLMIADHYLRIEDYYNAEKFYLRGLKKDSMMNYARLNLSTVYNLQGKNDKALQVLETAGKIDPKNDRVWYNMGLLLNEMKDLPGAEKAFAKAVELKGRNPRLYYNYGLLLNSSGKFKEAEKILQKGISIDPATPDLYFALTFVYIGSNDVVKAKQTGSKLKQLDPNNPVYAELFKNLGL